MSPTVPGVVWPVVAWPTPPADCDAVRLQTLDPCRLRLASRTATHCSSVVLSHGQYVLRPHPSRRPLHCSEHALHAVMEHGLQGCGLPQLAFSSIAPCENPHSHMGGRCHPATFGQAFTDRQHACHKMSG
nr:hypothetical protein CFP56_03376 [Quercus suber]